MAAVASVTRAACGAIAVAGAAGHSGSGSAVGLPQRPFLTVAPAAVRGGLAIAAAAQGSCPSGATADVPAGLRAGPSQPPSSEPYEQQWGRLHGAEGPSKDVVAGKQDQLVRHCGC